MEEKKITAKDLIKIIDEKMIAKLIDIRTILMKLENCDEIIGLLKNGAVNIDETRKERNKLIGDSIDESAGLGGSYEEQ